MESLAWLAIAVFWIPTIFIIAVVTYIGVSLNKISKEKINK